MTASPESRVAKLVSAALGPIPMGVLLAVAVGLRSGRGVVAGAGWGLLSVTCAALLPAVVSAPLRRRRPRTRATRLAYMGFAVAGALLGLLIVVVLPAPRDVRVVAFGFAAGLLCSIAVNVASVSSNHVSALTGGIILGAYLISPWLLLGGVLVAAVAWSRVKVAAHSCGEAALGAFIGLASALCVVAVDYFA